MTTRSINAYYRRVALRIAWADDFWWVTQARTNERQYLLASFTVSVSKHGYVFALHLLWLKVAIYVLCKTSASNQRKEMT